MEDVITEPAPPSRLLEEDLNSFTPPSPPLPSPFLIFSHSNSQQPLKPTLLIIAISSPSLSLFNHHLNSQTLTASLILPELPFSLPDNTFNIHSLSSTTLLAAARCTVPAHRAHSVANLLLNRIRPDSVIILDSLDPRNYRGRLSSDRPLAFKLESSPERKRADGEKLLGGSEYYPSGSVVDGLGAAILGRCQILNLRASLCVSWPQFDASVVLLLKDLLRRGVLSEFDFSLSDDEVLKFGRSKDQFLQSNLYI